MKCTGEIWVFGTDGNEWRYIVENCMADQEMIRVQYSGVKDGGHFTGDFNLRRVDGERFSGVDRFQYVGGYDPCESIMNVIARLDGEFLSIEGSLIERGEAFAGASCRQFGIEGDLELVKS
ncbi:hypothetical protein [Alcanivorax sp. DG881]|uniref:hypothetical protein n=1 Tax=Alcanivorax sp. DG881 TaxID=236097 RepID=UPI00058664E8|nr:hypothetical protein [Alcanivorax sp. DG881]